MNLHAWAEQRAKYSRAKHGRNDRGATLFECALVVAMAQAKAVHNARYVTTPPAPVPLGVSAALAASGPARPAAA